MTEDPVAAIARDPLWLAHRYDPIHDAIHFLHVTRQAHRQATFLTDQYLVSDRPPAVILRPAAIAAARPFAAPVHFILHSAFCCSTLMARALDHPGWAMTLKEPTILNDILGWRRRGATAAQMESALDDALTLLSRRFGPNETTAIKPSNVVNGFATTMLDMRQSSCALLMYAPLPDFLASIAKKGLDGRIFVRDLFLNQLKDGLVQLGFNQDQLFQQTDLQIAAMGWLVQIQLFASIVARFGIERVRTIRSDVLLANPAASIRAVAQLFGLKQDESSIAAVVEGPAFHTHSKDGTKFAEQARMDEYARATERHADEIAKVLAWTNVVAERVGIALEPGAPLV